MSDTTAGEIDASKSGTTQGASDSSVVLGRDAIAQALQLLRKQAPKEWVLISPEGLVFKGDNLLKLAIQLTPTEFNGCGRLSAPLVPTDPQPNKYAAATEAADAIEKLLATLSELVALVRGEYPSLLAEDSGGNARPDLEIDALLGRLNWRYL